MSIGSHQSLVRMWAQRAHYRTCSPARTAGLARSAEAAKAFGPKLPSAQAAGTLELQMSSCERLA